MNALTPASDAGVAHPETLPPVATRLTLRGLKVLVADDNPQSLALLIQVLQGFDVRNATQCANAEEALVCLDRERYDLVIVDGEMPGADGFEITSQLRANPGGLNFTVPVLIVCGFTPEYKIRQARDCGANLVVTKPIVPSVLLGRITWLARHPRPFVSNDTYVGPDRRFHHEPLPMDMPERRAEAQRLMAQPERAMSQNEIDSLFG